MTVRAAACVVATAGVVLAGCSPGTHVAADCEPAAAQPLQEGSHLIGDQPPPVPYSSVPPTSGWHSSGRPPDPGAYVEPVPGPQQVRVLEQGMVVVAYDPALPEGRIGALQQLAGEVDDVVVTPHPEDMGSPITLTAWGVLQRCESVTAADVAGFRDAHATTSDD